MAAYAGNLNQNGENEAVIIAIEWYSRSNTGKKAVFGFSIFIAILFRQVSFFEIGVGFEKE